MFSKFINSDDLKSIEVAGIKSLLEVSDVRINKCITNFISRHPLLLSIIDTVNLREADVNFTRLRLLRKVDRSSDNLHETILNFKVYTIYGTNILIYANRLANELAKITIYVRLFTNVKNRDFTIEVDNLRRINMYNIDGSMYNIIEDKSRDVGHVVYKQIKFINPLYELIEIYRRLSRIEFANSWNNIKVLESSILMQLPLYKSLPNKSSEFVNSILMDKIKSNSDKVIALTVKWFETIECVILSYGLAKLQIIGSKSNPDYYKKRLEDYLGREYKLVLREYDMQMIIDVRLKRYTIYYIKDDSNVHVLDVYLTASYDLVPFVPHGLLKIGYKYLLLSYLMIEYWFLEFMHIRGKIKTNRKDDVQKLLVNGLNLVSSISDKLPKLFIGTYIPLSLYKKETAHSEGFYPYIPEKYRYDYGDYRSIETKKSD